MSVFEKHDAFVKILQEEVKPKLSRKINDEFTANDIQVELERKFDELFGPLDDGDD